MAFYCNGKKGICPECRGEGTVIYSRETYRDENSVIITGFEGICNTCHGTGLKPMTNTNYFRAMSDEELAAWLARIANGDMYTDFCDNPKRTTMCDGKCVACIAEWLKQPAKDGE